jgi:hypothetical protein
MLLNEVASKSETITEFDDKIVMDGKLEIDKDWVLIAARSRDPPLFPGRKLSHPPIERGCGVDVFSGLCGAGRSVPRGF